MRWLRVCGAAVFAAVVAGCAYGSPMPTTHQGAYFSDRYLESPALLAQCGISHGTIKPPAGQPWYRSGVILPLNVSDSGKRAGEFTSWWDARSGVVVAGKTLAGWRETAAASDSMPSAVCGPGVSGGALEARIYPGFVNAWEK
jgi:hypothetical protein